MTYLGIDYGTKRIGLAKATDSPALATPLYTIPADNDVFEYLAKIIQLEKIDEIVVGVPVSFNGQENEFAKKVREFGDELAQKLKKKIHLQNEMLTTRQAERSGSADSDASAAALILQSFLDKRRK